MVTRRKPRLSSLSKWIEETVCLPIGLSAEPGPIRLAPYMRQIADAIGDPKVERVTCLKSARVGWTTVMSAAVAHFLVRDPCRVLTLWPTESDARGWVVSDLEPIFENSPKLRDKLPMPHPGRSDRTTLLHRIGERGAALTVVGAGAPRNLRRHTARVLMIDEADACLELSEGDPISLAVQRTLTFTDRKILVGSTPLDEETSHVCRLYAQSDQRIFEVPCPECGAFAEIKWEQIEWPEGRPEAAAWRCPHCEGLIPEKHKARAARAGRWRALRPGRGSHRGFRINALVSSLPQATWGALAAEFLRAKDDPATLRVFVNTVLAEPWRAAEGDDLDETALGARAEPFSLDDIPREVLALTVGCDVQADRLEATVCGWDRDGVCYVLAHEVLWGATDDGAGEVWRDLDHLLRLRPDHPAGGKLRIDGACVDAGDGGVMDTVQAFCAPRLGRRVFAIKGASGFARSSILRAKTKGKPLFIVGSDSIKARIFDRLTKGRAIRFSNTLPGEYFEQLSSERRVTRMVRGKPTVRFERKPGYAAEALDALVYAHAAHAALHLNYDARELELRAPTPPPPAPAVIRSRWMGR